MFVNNSGYIGIVLWTSHSDCVSLFCACE